MTQEKFKTIRVRSELHSKLKVMAAVDDLSIEQMTEKILVQYLKEELFKLTEWSKYYSNGKEK
jgi:predicted HicB family RNase H-like nuclease